MREFQIHSLTVDIHGKAEYPENMDSQPPLFEMTRWTVGSLTRYLSHLLTNDPLLQDIWVEGEISNLSRPSSGHVYFTLKDANAQLRCVMWRSDVSRLRIPLADGIAVEAHGYIGVYENGGVYQLYTDLVRPVGEGGLYREFLRLKSKLEAEGLFDAARKRPIPRLARRIGIVTSPTGAALRDVLHVLRRRNPMVEVVLSPALVQGEEAPPLLVEALHRLNQIAKPDLILLTRGGGSLEDLWAFNNEELVRAIVASPAPIISGIGHETDFTLADFAADLRAPTPTAAAELATPLTIHDLLLGLQSMAKQLSAIIQKRLTEYRQDLDALNNRLKYLSPKYRLQSERQRLDELGWRILAIQTTRLKLESARLTSLESQLQALNPRAVLQRGYAMVTRQTDGLVVTSPTMVEAGDALDVQVKDGCFEAQVTSTPTL